VLLLLLLLMMMMMKIRCFVLLSTVEEYFHHGCAALRVASDSKRYVAMSRYISFTIVHYRS